MDHYIYRRQRVHFIKLYSSSPGAAGISPFSSKMELLLFTVVMILSVARPGLSSTTSSFNVLQYGAVGDGSTNDSPAFLKAWKDVCGSKSQSSSLIIPAKTFLLRPLTFRGPCKSKNIIIQFTGNIVAPKTKGEYSGQINTWLGFSYVDGLTITGTGTVDGRGSIWWNHPCIGSSVSGAKCRPPSALTLYRCNGFELRGITQVNPGRSHITVGSCKGGKITNIRLVAPGDSPNTDGIDISGSTNIKVLDSFIGTGDDCIAISGGSSIVNISGITCGPGHGISIGSLGTGGSVDIVEDVTVRNCTITETLTGVRIKTWQTKAVRVSDVTYRGIVGTSLTQEAINLSCDQNIGCSNIVFDRVYLSSAVSGQKATVYCHNAHGTFSHTKPSLKKCLLPN